jgi:hypothetical protein
MMEVSYNRTLLSQIRNFKYVWLDFGENEKGATF